MPEEKPSLEATTLHSLLFASGWPHNRLAKAHGFANEGQITRYEREGKNLSREYLGKLIGPLGLPREAPDVLLWALRLIYPESAESLEPEGTAAGDPLALTPEERGRIHRTVLVAEWSRAEDLRRRLECGKREQRVAAARREAEALVATLTSAPAEDRRSLIAVFPEFRTWAVAEALSHASVRAVAHRVTEAQALAELALEVAGRVPGEARRARTEGYCTGFLANVRRVATEFDEASGMFARTWELWQAGEAAAYLPLAGWRLLDLEASLLRAQHRFSEALERLGQALALCGGEPLAAGRILLKRERVFYQLGDFAAALGTLADAAPFVEASRDPHLLFALHFNRASDLCSLERFTEAAPGLPAVRDMAIEQGRELDLIRVAWLASKVDAGQGRKEQAIAGLEQVSRDFAGHDLPYESALSSLDLAVLLLEAGRTAEVRSLALLMQRIFRAKRIAREALAALRLFCEAAMQEGATVELAKRVIAEVERARRSAPPS